MPEDQADKEVEERIDGSQPNEEDRDQAPERDKKS